MTQAAMKLYEHTAAIQLVEDWILEHDDEIRAAEGALPPELAELLETAQIGFKEKAESVALMVRGFLANVVALKAEIARLEGRKKHFEKAADGLKEYLRIQLCIAGEKKITTPRTTMWRQLTGPMVKVDEDVLGNLETLADDPDYAEFISGELVPERWDYWILKDRVLAQAAAIEAARVEAEKAGNLDADNGALPPGLSVTRTEILRIK
jgi:hypothetical protein